MNDNLPGDTVVTYASRSDMYRFLSQPAMMTYGYDILYQKVYQRLYMNTTAIHYKIIVIRSINLRLSILYIMDRVSIVF